MQTDWRQRARRLLSGALSAAMLFSAVPAVGANAADAAAGSAPVFQSARSYGGAYTDALHDIALTKDGGFVVSGYSYGPSEDPAWSHAGGKSGNDNDAVLLKFDSRHRLQWAKAYADGGTGIDLFESIDVLEDGRIVALGRSPFDVSGKLKGASWYLLVIDPDNPDSYTDFHIGGTAGNQGYGVAATSDGGFYAVGWSASKEGYLTSSTDRENYSEPVQLWAPFGSEDTLPGRLVKSGSDTVIIKFDSNLQVEYTALHNYCGMEGTYNVSSPSERVEDIAVDSEDNLYITGYNAVAKNVQNALIAKLSKTDGSVIWHRSAGRADMTTVPENSADYIKATYSGVAVLQDGSVVTTGTSTGDASTQEGWQITGTKDTLVVHYSPEGSLIHSESFGTIDDNNSRPEAIVAAPDGGYLLCGAQAGVMKEGSLLAKGYRWGSYGGEDAILVKYSGGDEVLWAENFGTIKGDWINGAAITDSGEIIAVGESNGKYGYPTWDNHGGIDGIILTTGDYPDAQTEPVNTAGDGNVVWADGTYTAAGSGYGGDGSVSVTVTVEQGKITAVTGENIRDTKAYYRDAAFELHSRILQAQGTDVDVVSGASYSSTGILEAADHALSQAAAKHVDDLIDTIETASTNKKAAAAQTAADAYSELGTYALSCLTGLDKLQAAAQTYGITLLTREAIATELKETQPEAPDALRYNDSYYAMQAGYFDLVHAYALSEQGYDGEGVRIAVIDSGVTDAHQDLDYSLILDGYDYDADRPMTSGERVDNNGHGTAVTGILSAVSNNKIGVAGLFDRLEIVPLRLTPKSNHDASSEKVARAIRDAVDTYHVDVITTSLDVKDTQALREAVDYAAEKGVLITGASGNSSSSLTDPYLYPASYDSVISVGAVDKNGSVRSNSQKNDQVYVTAPGEDIAVLDISRSGRCKLAGGTSYASPMVAALAVAAKQQDRELNLQQFKYLLRASVTDAGEPGYDNAYGYGIVDYARFLQALQTHPFTHIQLDNTRLSLTAGDTARLGAEVTSAADTTAAIRWSSSDEDIATVDENGTVTAVAQGECQIIALCEGEIGAQALCDVTVAPAEETAALKLERHELRLYAGQAFTLNTAAVPAEESLRWSSTDGTIAAVDENGVVTALAVGQTEISVTGGNGQMDTCTVTVLEDGAPSVRLDSGALSVQAGEQAKLDAEVTPEGVEPVRVIWSSSDDSVVSVDENGTLTAAAPGEADITVTCILLLEQSGEETESPAETAEEPAAQTQEAAPEAEAVEAGQDVPTEEAAEEPVPVAEEALPVVAEETAPEAEETAGAEPESASLPEASDTAEEVPEDEPEPISNPAPSAVQVTVSDVCHVTVTAPAPVGMRLNPAELTLVQGEQSRLTAAAEPENASIQVLWSSSDEGIATVNAYGKVTAVAPGSAVISAVGAGNEAISAECSVTVTAAPVDLSHAEVTAAPQTYTGQALEPVVTVVLNGRLVPADLYDVTYSHNQAPGTGAITVTGKGDCTGTAYGTFTILPCSLDGAVVSAANQTYTGKALQPAVTVTLNGETLDGASDYAVTYQDNTEAGTATVTVTGQGTYSGTAAGTFQIEKASQTLTVTPASVQKGKTVTLNVKGSFGKLSYVTSNKKVATVTAAGIVKGVAAGTTTITVTAAGDNNHNAATKAVKLTVYACATPAITKAENVNGGVKLTWGKVAGAAKYRIFYKTGKGGWTRLADTTATAYTWKKAKSGTAYTFTVRCISSDGKAYTSDCDTAGKAITYIAAPAISNVQNVNGGMKITWGKVAGAAKYRIFYKAGKGGWTRLADTTATAYTWKKAKPGTAYAFTVRCISKDGKAYTSGCDTAGKRLTYVAAPTLSGVKNSKTKTMTVGWNKLSGVTGYQIQYSTDKGFKSGNKAVTVKKAAAVSQAVSSLSKGRTYYVRIRSYKTVSGKNVYSAWSTAKSVKITK